MQRRVEVLCDELVYTEDELFRSAIESDINYLFTLMKEEA